MTVIPLFDIGPRLMATEYVYLVQNLETRQDEEARLTDDRAVAAVLNQFDPWAILESPIILDATASERYREILASERVEVAEPPFALDAFQ
jgi:hypothetical protein